MAPLQTGDKFPTDVKFGWAPILDDDLTVCGRPQPYDASKEWAGKKVVIVSVPGAFTPTCSVNHIPPYIQNLETLKSKGVDKVAIIASNDPFVMNAWGKVNKVTGEDILFLSDTNTFFSKNHAWMTPNGDRNARWAIIVEKDGTVSYVGNEPAPGVTVSGAEAVISKL